MAWRRLIEPGKEHPVALGYSMSAPTLIIRNFQSSFVWLGGILSEPGKEHPVALGYSMSTPTLINHTFHFFGVWDKFSVFGLEIWNNFCWFILLIFHSFLFPSQNRNKKHRNLNKFTTKNTNNAKLTVTEQRNDNSTAIHKWFFTMYPITYKVIINKTNK